MDHEARCFPEEPTVSHPAAPGHAQDSYQHTSSLFPLYPFCLFPYPTFAFIKFFSSLFYQGSLSYILHVYHFTLISFYRPSFFPSCSFSLLLVYWHYVLLAKGKKGRRV